MNEKQLHLPACSQCGERAPAGEMYITGSYERRYFCDYTEQCIYHFNRGGWRRNSGTIRKLRERGLLMAVYLECNEIGKAILARYISEEDIIEETQYIDYQGDEEATAAEIFQIIYQQLTPQRRLQLA
jgi:hypothetical protein